MLVGFVVVVVVIVLVFVLVFVLVLVIFRKGRNIICLLYTSDAADE